MIVLTYSLFVAQIAQTWICVFTDHKEHKVCVSWDFLLFAIKRMIPVMTNEFEKKGGRTGSGRQWNTDASRWPCDQRDAVFRYKQTTSFTDTDRHFHVVEVQCNCIFNVLCCQAMCETVTTVCDGDTYFPLNCIDVYMDTSSLLTKCIQCISAKTLCIGTFMP